MEKKDTEKEEERHGESMLITHFHWYSTSLTSVPINSKYNSKKNKQKKHTFAAPLSQSGKSSLSSMMIIKQYNLNLAEDQTFPKAKYQFFKIIKFAHSIPSIWYSVHRNILAIWIHFFCYTFVKEEIIIDEIKLHNNTLY